jgi:TolB-like protein/DNA-binding winged helix-turn-helix (wHTH) protein/tetratricopeptide (TPR) repeat protein
MAAIPREIFRFGSFELDAGSGELRRGGTRVRLERLPADLLILLVRNPDRVVTRAEIVDALWGKDVFVDVETGVNTAIRKIRQALGDSSESPRFVETIPARGYRFIGTLEAPDTPAPVGPEAERASSASPAPGRARWRPPFSAMAAVAVALVATAALAGLWRLREGPPRGQTLAVLPFENLSGDPARDYLADGLAEETIASLGQIDPGQIAVVGRTSVMSYKGTKKSLATIGRELGVDYLVESSIRAEGTRLRITSKLIRVSDQTQIWTESYDREPSSMLGLQQELSTAIAGQVRLRLSPERREALTRRQTRNADAYDLYLRGRGFANRRTPATTVRAIEYFQRAVTIDPGYALAWSGLADAYSASPINSDADPREVGPRAREAAREAVAADGRLAEARFSLAYVKWLFDWDWPAAISELQQVIALDPGHAFSHMVLGHVLSQSGRHAEAAREVQRAREMDPFSPMTHAISSQVAFQARQYSDALSYARQAILLDNEFWIGHITAAQALVALERVDEALASIDRASRLSGGNIKALSLKGYVLARTGRPAEAREVLAMLEAASRSRYVPRYAMALVHAGLGDRAAALDALERAAVERDVHMIFLPVDPKWDAYRSDPRFGGVLARCGFR